VPSVVEVAGTTQTAVITTQDTVTAELLTLAIVAVPGAETVHILEGDNPVPGTVEIAGPTQAAVISVVSALTAAVVELGTVLVPIDTPVQIIEAGSGALAAASRSVYNTRDYPAAVVTVPAPEQEPSLDWYNEFAGGNHVDGSTYEVAVTYAGWSNEGEPSETMLGPSTSTVCENGNTLSVLPQAPLETRAVGAWVYLRKDGGAWHRSGSASDNQDKIIGFGDDGLYGGVLFDFRVAGASPPGSNTAVDANGDPIDDPILAPTVVRIAGVDLDTYYGAYSYVGADLAETALSPISDPITVTDRGSAITFRLPELTPSGVCFVNLYLSTDGSTWHKQGSPQPWDFVIHYIWMYDSAGSAPSPGTPQSTLHEIQRAWDAAVEDGGGIVEWNPTDYPSDLLSPLHFRGRTAGGTRIDGLHLISHGGHSTNPIARGRLVYGGPAGVTALGASASNCKIEGLDLVDPDGLVKCGLAVFDATGGGGFNQAWIDCHFAALASGGIGFAVLEQHKSPSTHSASGITFDRCIFQADAWGVDQCGAQTLNNQFRDSDTRTSGNGDSANSGEFRFWDAPARVKVPAIAANGQYVFYVSDQGGARADLDLDYIYIEAKHSIQAFYLSARAINSPRLTLRESYLVNQTGEVNLAIYAGAENPILLEHNVSLAGDIQFGGAGSLTLFAKDGNPASRLIAHPTPGYQPLDLGYSSDGISTPSLRLTTSPVAGYVLTSDAEGDGAWQPSGGWPDRAQQWGLVAAWPLSNLVDAYGVRDLTNNNAATFSTGKIGNAVYLTRATPQWLSLAAESGPGDTDFLVAAWVWLTDETVGPQTVIAQSDGTLYAWDLYYQTNRFRWYVERSGDNSTAVANTFGAVSAAAWHLVIAAHDAVNDLISISVDGGAWDSVAHSGGVRTDSLPITFGAISTPTEPLGGRIDAVTLMKSPPSGLAAIDDVIRDFIWNGGTGREFAGPWGVI
jgi:hypothetical protein